MTKTATDLVEVLFREGKVRREQLEEARHLLQSAGTRLEDALVRLGYVSARDIAEGLAELHDVPFLDLTGLTIPPRVLELMPESVARENVVLPLAMSRGALWVVVSDPGDRETLQKLEFILNQDIQVAVAVREQIVEAINRHYGQTETESVDSMLAEFTDTAIGFTDTGGELVLALEQKEDEKPAPRMRAAIPGATDALVRHKGKRPGGSPLVERRATVRYYQRMSPERMFPLLVVLSKKAVQEIVKRGVSQTEGEKFRVALDSVVEVEPVLPGCGCFPPREQVVIREDTITTTFWVVPHVLGRIMHARVLVRQDGRVLAEIPLEMCVAKQSLTLLLGGLSLLLPFLLMLLKHYHLDFESQIDDGFGLYAQAGNWALRSLSPELLTGALLLAAAAAYFWLRPRKRDVFWDVAAVAPEQPADQHGQVSVTRDPEEDSAAPPRLDTAAEHQATLLACAERHFAAGQHAQALPYYESGLALGPARYIVYHHAALAAHKAHHTDRALAILQEAAARLSPNEIGGGLWYNLACFATRLGRLDDAMHYLNQAIDRGCTDPDKFRHDPDLEPLRWRADFKGLMAELRQHRSMR
jgi:hypothetical protein